MDDPYCLNFLEFHGSAENCKQSFDFCKQQNYTSNISSQALNGKLNLEMPKKKKKSLGTESLGTIQSNLDVQIPIEDFLQLKLTSQSISTKSRPQLWLTEDDAKRIDILQNEEVLLLVHVDGNISNAAICHANITVNKETISKMGSPSTPKSSRISSGSCQVTPATLAEKLCAGNLMEFPDVQELIAPVLPLTSTPSKGFSFARGGGGDALTSPSSLSKGNLSPRSPLRQTSKMVWVIPLHATFGKRLEQMVCQRAACLNLTVEEDLPTQSFKIVQQLVLANYNGRVLTDHENLNISYRGKQLLLQATHIVGAPANTNLKIPMETLCLTDSVSTTSIIIKALQQAMLKRNLYFFRVDQETDVIISRHDDPAPTRKTQTTQKFVAGLSCTIEQVKELLLPPLMNPCIYGTLKPPRGALLHGPSGVGKSALANELASMFTCDYKIKVERVHCASLQSHTSIVGEAERRLTKLFQQSQDTLLIMDDIHLICPKRGGSNPGVDRLAATLLSLLDGIKKEGTATIVVLAITSNPSLLDPALRRPGRLDAEIEVPIPDEVTRKEILIFLLANMDADIQGPYLSVEDLISMSRLAKGFNGADCVLAIKEAVRKAANETPKDTKVIQLSIDHLKTSIRLTKPSTISSATVEIPQMHWTSIGGMELVKEKLREAIELPLTHSHLFEALHIPPPRGVLLYGPPGCSKTLMARALATEGQMNFLAVKGPELLSKWLGESERALASLFRRARMASPCIIFFDEIDAIAAKRGSSQGSSGGERLLSQLLTELDGINSAGSTIGVAKPSRVIVVGATNRPDLLDTALTRPGRIDRMIYVGLPDVQSRKSIFEIGLKGKACRDDIVVSVKF